MSALEEKLKEIEIDMSCFPTTQAVLAALRTAIRQRNECWGDDSDDAMKGDDAELLSILNGEQSENGGGE